MRNLTDAEYAALNAGLRNSTEKVSGGRMNTQKREITDTERLDWLESKDVQVRNPMHYGSMYMFHAQDISAEGESYKTNLRARIDREIMGGE